MRKKITLVASLAFAAALCAGFGATNMQAEAQVDWADFKITETAVRLGTGTQEDPTGLRFKVNCPDVDLGETAEYYTMISFTSSVEGEAQEYNLKVPATKWRTDNSGWNAVLLEIPASDYVTEITAQSFVEVDGEVVHTSNSVTSSIAKTASKVLNGGMVDAKLDAFVAGAVSSIEIDKETVALSYGESVQLEATTAPAGYGVVWASDNTNVATVSKNGKVTVVGAGTANVTASMGGVVDTVVVNGTWNDTYDYENDVVASPLQWVRSASVDAQKVVTLGETKAIDAMGAFADIIEEEGANTHGNFLVQINKNYIDWVFANHDYFTFTVYADMPYIRYLRDEATTSYFYGYQGNNLYYLEGTPVTIDGANLYRFEIAYTREVYDKAMAVEGNSLKVRFSFVDVLQTNFSQTPVQKLYFDDFRACDYTTDVIDFEDGKATPIGMTWFTKYGEALSVVETKAGDGNYALKFDSNSGFNRIGVSADYLHYIFNVAKADFIEWKWFPEDATATTTYSTRLVVNGKADSTGTTQTYYANGGYFLCKIPRSTYLIYFNENGTLISGAAITDVALGLYVKNPANTYSLSGYADGFAPGWNTYQKDTDFDKQCVNVIDDALTEKFKAGSLRQAGDAIELETTASPHAFGFSKEFMMWAFYTKGAKSVTFKYEVSGYDITGFRFANNQSYCRCILWYQKGDGTYTYASTTNYSYQIVDGYALVTVKASDFTMYFDETGAYKAGSHKDIASGGVSIGARLQLSIEGDGATTTKTVPNATLHMLSGMTLNF